jgi:luciferase family oxidoreductase group 1
MRLPPLSVLELAMVENGHTLTEAFALTTDLARQLDGLGFQRVWTTEHHGAQAVGSVSPPVMAAHLASATSRARIGSGGVMVPNHAPLVIAEQFFTLAALYPGRIDLGMGRGPGTFDPVLVKALRRGGEPTTDAEYRADLIEVLDYLSGEMDKRVIAGSGPAELPQPWLLSSSSGGAELAAELGLPIAYAHHLRPTHTVESLDFYRKNFRPSRWQQEPWAMVSVEAFAADTEAEVEFLARPMDILREGLLAQHADVQLVTPAEAQKHVFSPETADQLAQMRTYRATGTPETVVAELAALAELTGADELMLVNGVYDLAARVRSYELIAAAAAE